MIACEFKNIRRGGMNRFEATKNWASKLFDDLLKFKGTSTTNMIGELLVNNDLRPFVEILTKFILEVKRES